MKSRVGSRRDRQRRTGGTGEREKTLRVDVYPWYKLGSGQGTVSYCYLSPWCLRVLSCRDIKFSVALENPVLLKKRNKYLRPRPLTGRMSTSSTHQQPKSTPTCTKSRSRRRVSVPVRHQSTSDVLVPLRDRRELRESSVFVS